jgi:hypothetical protein
MKEPPVPVISKRATGFHERTDGFLGSYFIVSNLFEKVQVCVFLKPENCGYQP